MTLQLNYVPNQADHIHYDAQGIEKNAGKWNIYLANQRKPEKEQLSRDIHLCFTQQLGQNRETLRLLFIILVLEKW